MLQNTHHFLFPQIYFGRLKDSDELYEEEIDEQNGTLLLFDANLCKQTHPNIGLRIDWTDDNDPFFP